MYKKRNLNAPIAKENQYIIPETNSLVLKIDG